jgi:hypothetical protein
VPCRNSAGLSTTTAPPAVTSRLPAPVGDGEQDDRDQSGDESGDGEPDLGHEADPARRERLDEDADEGGR